MGQFKYTKFTRVINIIFYKKIKKTFKSRIEFETLITYEIIFEINSR